jgi:hypothetical protein
MHKCISRVEAGGGFSEILWPVFLSPPLLCGFAPIKKTYKGRLDKLMQEALISNDPLIVTT